MMAGDFPGHFLFHDSYVVVRGWHNGAPKNLLTIFVDVVFTNLLEPLFTMLSMGVRKHQRILACGARASPINPLATLIRYQRKRSNCTECGSIACVCSVALVV
jgi:hypothetical protein